MTYHILLGAGFSRNWGGWLASEVFEYLLGRPEIAGNDEIRRILWTSQSKGGFEHALELLQIRAASGDTNATENLATLQTAVVAMFNDMNHGFDQIPDWEFNDQADSRIATFLTRFDSIFSLNQDLFLERHYLSSSPELLRPDRWDGAAMPALAPIGQGYASIVGQRWQIHGKDNFQLQDRIQPCIKLHGSTNWNAPDGTDTLVIGGNKANAIGGSPILRWYFDEFVKALSAGDARLMVIGYGFRDQHINDLLINAVTQHGLKFFNVSPAGSDHARQVNPTVGAAIYAPNELEDAFERGLIGASQRSLSEIFGTNKIELGKLLQFFEV
jgi:SIR2-like domain